jgi:ABC-type uncharacterized transport system permease subunit
MNDAHSQSIRDRMQAAAARLARVKRIDRLANGVITLGGVGVVVSVLFIFLFILSQAFPLFRSAKVSRAAKTPTVSEALQAALVLGVDEYQRKLYGVSAAGAVRVSDLEGAARSQGRGSRRSRRRLVHLRGAQRDGLAPRRRHLRRSRRPHPSSFPARLRRRRSWSM